MLGSRPSTTEESTEPPVVERAPGQPSFRIWGASIFFLLALSCAPGWSSAIRPVRVNPRRVSLSQSELFLGRAPAHAFELTPTMPTMALPTCESVRPAEALLTPDPLLPIAPDGPLVRVSFVIGSDGRVHSAFVLYSGGANEDAAVLRAVRGWRYRPALCNGVPTDSEVRVRFSIHE
jgi:TonB family protein